MSEVLKVDYALGKITELENKSRGLSEQITELTGSLEGTDDCHEGLVGRVSEIERAQGRENHEVYKQLEKTKERVARLENHLNYQIDENRKLNARMDLLEKKLLEPIAQRLVDQARPYFMSLGAKHFCERCHCHKDFK